jgi:NitT/TauT family transport system permease protein
VIASQAVPILALAPIIIVALGAIGLEGLFPKAIIAGYLCFFPVTIAMTKGLTAADRLQMDLMRTYSASRAQVFWKLRLPTSLPFLFASHKVAAAASLVGGTADRRAGGARCQAAGGILFRADRADLGGAGRRRRALGEPGRAAGHAGTRGGPSSRGASVTAALVAIVAAGFAFAIGTAHGGGAGAPLWVGVSALVLLSAWLVQRLGTMRDGRLADLLAPLAFGAILLALWEVLVVGFAVPMVLLPAPSAIATRFAASTHILAEDFVQTFLKAVLSGYVIGNALGFGIALLVDRVPFLRRGLLPVANLASALPIIGIAPIMVMWFGFDWQSKAAVVVVMTFFPMLVNTLAGLEAAGALERDLMRSYAASHTQTLRLLRLPAALPFVFTALKINAPLALIGAIVAEFFGSPTAGMGFRITTEAAKLALDLVWAEIVVAAVAGSVFYGLVALAERAATFWHPSIRR